MDLTPESETYRAALSSAVATFFGLHVRVGVITHFNAETVKQLVRDMCEPAYRAGREDAARLLESRAAELDGSTAVWDGNEPGALRQVADEIVRGNQPRTVQEPGPSEHTQDGGE